MKLTAGNLDDFYLEDPWESVSIMVATIGVIRG